jgi:O-antigen biosynthesis protein
MTETSILGTPGDDPLVIAFYLPQFHPVPENDAWWGPGFTEWRNAVRAYPEFEGHYQPHLPGELGFYDLRLPETRVAQAELARQHGVDAFCYYHYWFSGRRILERPFNEVLESGSPDFPFCLAWANEPWSRNWDGGSQEVLIGQHYSDEDHDAHIEYLITAFRDHRYVRVKDRPLFLIYNPSAIPDMPGVLARWREKAIDAGVGNPLFVCFETFGFIERDPAEVGCEAAAEFLPHGQDRFVERFLNHESFIQHNLVINYSELASGHLHFRRPSWPHFRCIVPNWDNTARKKKGWSIVTRGSTPALFQEWASGAIQQARREGTPVLFINAWNEWAEGTHLEPDLHYGRQYLEALAAARGIDPAERAQDAPDSSGDADLRPGFNDLPAAQREINRLMARTVELERSVAKYFAAGEAAAGVAIAALQQRVHELESQAAHSSELANNGRAVRVPRSKIGKIVSAYRDDGEAGFRTLTK